MANRLFVDIKETAVGEITGTVKFPRDSTFVFEALAEVLYQFSQACEIPPEEIAADLIKAALDIQGVTIQ